MARVRVGTNRNMPNALIHHRPKNELQAKFSMEFCMAILLLEGRAGLAEFTDEVVNRPDVKAMIEKVDFGVDARGRGRRLRQDDDRSSTSTLNDGRTISGRADFGKGSPANPMTYDEVADKFRECAEYGRWDRSRAETVVEMVRDLRSLARSAG